jgi:hypothetical protein
LSARELILERCQGNPFFIEETVQALLESGLLYEEGGYGDSRRLDRSALPLTMLQVVLGGSSADRDAPVQASVIGRSSAGGCWSSHRPAPRRLRIGQADLDRDLWALEDRG